jgi:hypothetical protein
MYSRSPGWLGRYTSLAKKHLKIFKTFPAKSCDSVVLKESEDLKATLGQEKQDQLRELVAGCHDVLTELDALVT